MDDSINGSLIVLMFGYRNSEGTILRSGSNENRKSSSPEKEDRYYTTRGSASCLVDENGNGKVSVDAKNGEDKKLAVWPKLYIALSNKEKEEDFLAMKGCKPPQRPKKRAKIIQRSLLVSYANKDLWPLLIEKLTTKIGFVYWVCLLFINFFTYFVLVGGGSWWVLGLGWLICAKRDMKLGRRKALRR